MMDFKEFCNYVEKNVRIAMPEQYRDSVVDIIKVTKNNGACLRGLTMRREGSNVSPTLYLEGFYEKYAAGYGLGDVLKEVAETYALHDGKANRYAEVNTFISDYEKAKEHLALSICNTWRNQDRFDMIPHVETEDLSFIFKLVVASDVKEQATITVTKQMLDAWNVSGDICYKDALENMKKINPPVVQSMGSILGSYGLVADPDVVRLESAPKTTMYVISNQLRMDGAVYMFDDESLASVAAKMETDVIVLPSSIHEVICISAENTNLHDLEEMVKSINMETVIPEEQLSDNVYYYDAQKHELMIASEHEKKVQTESQQTKENDVSPEKQDNSMRRGGR